MKIIILLGNENDGGNQEKEELSLTAKQRCDGAIKIYQEDATAEILPTGSFGRHFNNSLKAHGKLMEEYLIKHDVVRDRILQYTESSNTVEDALCARKCVVDAKASSVVVVTSNFHLERTRYIFGRIFPDFQIDFVGVEAGSGSEEHKKIQNLQNDWMNTPLYPRQDPGKDSGKGFPLAIYQNAEKEHKHYDQISWIAVTGMIFCFGYMINFFFNKTEIGNYSCVFKAVAFICSSVFLSLLWLIYARCAQTARNAREFMKRLEMAFGQFGFSSSNPRKRFASVNSELEAEFESVELDLPKIVLSLLILMIVCLFFSIFMTHFNCAPL